MSSSSDHPWIYDVFISFRGVDTRPNIVSHLYAALKNSGVNTFLDNEMLRKGEELGAAQKRAIEGSQISIIVFSPNYAESSWCLNELLHIMECRITYDQVVIPLFYNVEPMHVRKHAAGTIVTHRGIQIKEILMPKWRSALTQVTNFVGWDAKNFRNKAQFCLNYFIICAHSLFYDYYYYPRNEGELVKKIVDQILKKLDLSLLSITECPIGLEPRLQTITKFIDDQSSQVCMIGIWGMGGSGKLKQPPPRLYTIKSIVNSRVEQVSLKIFEKSVIIIVKGLFIYNSNFFQIS